MARFTDPNDPLLVIRNILGDEKEKAENSVLYRWASLVQRRLDAGESIEGMYEWLEFMMVGMSEREFLAPPANE